MTGASEVGQWMAAAGAALIVIEVVLFLPRALRLRRIARRVSAEAGVQVAVTHRDLARLRDARAELEYRSRPYRRVYGWLGGPLTFALGQRAWIRRERARPAARAAGAE